MNPSEVREHLLGTRYDPVSLSEARLFAIYAAVHGANSVKVFAPEGGQNIEILDDVLLVVQHLLMMRWHAATITASPPS